jgi:hypothetical protein
MPHLTWTRRRRPRPATQDNRPVPTGRTDDPRGSSDPDPARRELAVRGSDGLRVALFWRPAHDDVMVCVDDEHTGTRFELHVASERALHAFYHPDVYAA